MPNYRRSRVPGGSFFFTLVTYERRKLFTSSETRSLLGDCVRECQASRPFEVDAMVLLADHLHTIWTLPTGDAEYSSRWAWIKKEFTKRWIRSASSGQTNEATLRGERRRSVWQPRFWEHTLRDEEDFERHFDYVHYNPVKHGLVQCPHEWEPSSFHRWVERGVYDRDWACGDSSGVAKALANLDRTTGE